MSNRTENRGLRTEDWTHTTEDISEFDRYHRQSLIDGWDQSALESSTVSIVGSDYLAQYVAVSMAAVGVGNIRLIDTARSAGEMFLDFQMNSDIRVHSLEEYLAIINPEVEVMGLASSLVSESSKYFLEESDVIIDATNSPRSKTIAIGYAIDHDIPLYSSSCMPNYGKIIRCDKESNKLESLLYNFKNHEQDEFVSIVLGGLITEEVKNSLMGDEELKYPLYYNLTSKDRFSFNIGKSIAPRDLGEFGNKKILMVGAGALGNFVALGLSKLGVGRIDIIDPDNIENSNLNRQVLYYDSVGEKKANALSGKIKTIGRDLVESDSFVRYFNEQSKLKLKYDLIMDCVDNFTARSVISDYAIKYRTPLVSGGTNFESGQAAVYIPGKTACMDCQIDIHRLGEKAEEERIAAGCLLAPNPSVIMTNQIIAGIMVNEAKTVFNPEKYGAPINGTLRYNSTWENRQGVNHIKNVCKCKAKGGLKVQAEQTTAPTPQPRTQLIRDRLSRMRLRD